MFPLTISPDGSVTGPANPTVEFIGSTVRIRPSLQVTFDPGDMNAVFRVPGTSIYNVSGLQSGYLPPVTTWEICISSSCFPFSVNADGSVYGPASPTVEFIGSTVRVRPSLQVTFDPGQMTAAYRIPGSTVYNVWGIQSGRLPPATSWEVCAGSTCRPFSVGADGSVSGQANLTVDFAGSTVSFRPPLDVTFSPSNPTAVYRVLATTVYNVSGIQSGRLPPGTMWSLCSGPECEAFTINPDYSFSPSAVTVAGVRVDLRCGDVTPPTLVALPDFYTFARSSNGAVLTYPLPTATDNSGSVVVACTPASGSNFAVGSTPVSCTAHDPTGNVATSGFVVHVQYEAPTGGAFFRQPINPDSSSIFKLGRTVPVKFTLSGVSASITNLAARLYVAKVSEGTVGTYEEAESNATLNSNDLFRYATDESQYIYNLSTGNLTRGTWLLKADLGDGVLHEIWISLK